MLDIRPSPIAGQWYPGNSAQLAETVDAYLEDAAVLTRPGELVGVVAPHAGHRYSGAVAAHAFKAARGLDVDLVVVAGPLHSYHPAPLLTTGHEAYATPLGNVPVDRETIQSLQAVCEIPLQMIRNDPEHSLEIELPFLQRVLPGFKLLPIMIREQTLSVAQTLARALAEVLKGRRTLLVASSDLSHFYPQAAAQQLDKYLLGKIEAFDPAGVLQAEDEGQGFACGKGAIAAVLLAAEQLGANQARVVKHATSGDVTRDYSSVVGYGAAVIWKE